jgi:hypothetical protein
MYLDGFEDGKRFKGRKIVATSVSESRDMYTE